MSEWQKYLEVRTSRASGPGGQGVNKTESRVEVRFMVDEAHWLSPYQRQRLYQLFPTRITDAGELIVTCQVHRSQKQNLEECVSLLQDLFDKAALIPKKRIPTRASRGSKEKRLKGKKSRSSIKQGRSGNWD